MKSPTLTKQEWTEVYYALETKRIAIEIGKYDAPVDDGLNLKEWANKLRAIAIKVARATLVIAILSVEIPLQAPASPTIAPVCLSTYDCQEVAR